MDNNIKKLNKKITKIEFKTKDTQYKQLLRNILDEIDSFLYKTDGTISIRYYRYKDFEI